MSRTARQADDLLTPIISPVPTKKLSVTLNRNVNNNFLNRRWYTVIPLQKKE